MNIASHPLPLVFAVALGASAQAQTCFERDSVLPVIGGSPSLVALGDFDADGDLDLGMTTWHYPEFFSTFRTRLNLGAGSWSSEASFTTPLNVAHMEFVDIDGDGDDDLVEASQGLRVHRSLGASGFRAAELVLAAGTRHFAAFDLDGDGDLDLAAIVSSGVVILRNLGDGSFTAVPGPQGEALRAAIGDFDGDGDGDLALVDQLLHEIRVALNDGSGGFAGTPATFAVPMNARYVHAQDLNGDGVADIAVGHDIGRVSILIAVPSGFAPHVQHPIAHAVWGMTVGDYDEDGDVDLAVLGTGTMSILANAGSGTFAAPSVSAVGGGANTLDVGDIDTDSDVDLLILDQFGAIPFVNCALSGTPTCFGDGSGTPCPCGNESAVGARAGCLHSASMGGTLRASGSARISADSLLLRADALPNSTALYFQGTAALIGGLGTQFGDGLKCVGGTIVRLGVTTNVAGSSEYPGPGQQPITLRGGVVTAGERHYQVWYRNAASFCAPAAFNLTNALRVEWRP